MNLVDCYVEKVLSQPYEAHGAWWVKVQYVSWGHSSTGDVHFKTKEEAEKIGVRYKFLA